MSITSEIDSVSIEVSVIIAARNVGSLLDTQLVALSRQTFAGQWEVVVVDNGSSDDTSERALAWTGRLPGLRVVSAPLRTDGPAYPRNVGAAVAKGSLLLFCDADDEVDEGWLSAMVQASSEGDVLGGRLEYRRLNESRQLRWAPADVDFATFEHLGFLPSFPGANLGVDRKVFEALGGFDEGARGAEDVDLCWRAQLAGYRLRHVEAAVVSYRVRSRLFEALRQAARYGESDVRLFQKFGVAGLSVSVSEAFRWWALVPWHLLCAMRPSRTCHELRRMSYRFGRARGSLAYRRFAP